MQARRSARPRRIPSHDDQADDRLLKVALKRSELEFQSSTSSSFLASLESVPTIQPSPEQFADPISLWESLSPIGLKYGAVKLVPPAGWKPPFCLDLNKLQFKVREQLVHRLASGNAFKFPKGIWTAEEFRQFGEKFKAEQPWDPQGDRKKLSVEELEAIYWRLVETQATPLSVIYGADIEVSEVGSGFPSPTDTSDDKMSYAQHSWNLLNLPKCDGSLLKTFPRIIPGVTCPWLYIGMLFSSFCWHTEDNYFAAVNYQHVGEDKIWYVVPPHMAPTMEKVMREYLGHKRPEEVLHSLTVQLPPSILVRNNIPVHRVVQRENEYVLLWPRTFHCGFNTGFNCNEACNIAPPVWLDWGHLAIPAYRHLRSMCIPYEQLIHTAACGPVERTDALEKLSEALARIIVEDYSHRQVSTLRQLPLVASAQLARFLPALDFCKASKNSMGGVRRSANDSERLKNCFATVCEESVNLFHSSDADFLKQFESLTGLPCLDCDHCHAACYQSFVSCPHSESILCITCVNSGRKLDCHCSTNLFVYRFPLRAQLRLLHRLTVKLSALKSKTEEKIEVKQEEGSFMSRLPTPRSAETLERFRAAPAKLGYTGPFIWKQPSVSATQQGPELLEAKADSPLEQEAVHDAATNQSVPVEDTAGPTSEKVESKSVNSATGRRQRRSRATQEGRGETSFIPIDLPAGSSENDFRAWVGMSGVGRRATRLQPPPRDFEIAKSGICDILHRVSTRHLMGALLEEESSGESSGGESESEHELPQGVNDDSKPNPVEAENSPSSKSTTAPSEQAQSAGPSGHSESLEEQMKRKRGRPPKPEHTDESLEESSQSTNEDPNPRKRRRNRRRFFTPLSRRQKRQMGDSKTEGSSGNEELSGSESAENVVEKTVEAKGLIQSAQVSLDSSVDEISPFEAAAKDQPPRRRPPYRKTKRRGYGWTAIPDTDSEMEGTEDEEAMIVTKGPPLSRRRSRQGARSAAAKVQASVLLPEPRPLTSPDLFNAVNNLWGSATGVEPSYSIHHPLPNPPHPLQAHQTHQAPSFPVPARALDPFSRLLLSAAQQVGRRPMPEGPRPQEIKMMPSVQPGIVPRGNGTFGMTPFMHQSRNGSIGSFMPPAEAMDQRSRRYVEHSHLPVGPTHMDTSMLMPEPNPFKNSVPPTPATQSHNVTPAAPSTTMLILENGELLLEKAAAVVSEDRQLRSSAFGLLMSLGEQPSDSGLKAILGSKIATLDKQIEEFEQSMGIIKALTVLKQGVHDFSAFDSNAAFSNILTNAVKMLINRILPPEAPRQEAARPPVPARTTPPSPVHHIQQSQVQGNGINGARMEKCHGDFLTSLLTSSAEAATSAGLPH